MSMTPKYCWDTSVFLAWFNRDAVAPLADIDALIDDIHALRCTLIVPVTIYTEIVRAKHSPEQISAFDGFLERSNVLTVEQSIAIAKKAEQIRSRGIEFGIDGKKAKRGEERKIKTPDASILATGILSGANVLHSLEPRHLQLSGSMIVDGLKISKPVQYGGQRALDMPFRPLELPE